MNMSVKIRCIIFDVGGVLIKPLGYNELFRIINVRLGKKVFTRKYIKQFQKGKISGSEYFRNFSKKSGLPASHLRRVFLEEYQKSSEMNQSVVIMAEKLRKKGYKTPIISNAIKIPEDFNKKCKIHKGFGPVFLSYKIGLIKPHKNIFQLFLKKTKHKPSECIFIDDKETNLYHPEKLGIWVIHFKNPAQLRKDLEKLGVKI